MGGNACKHLGVKRINKQQYISLVVEVKSLLIDYVDRIAIPHELKSKEDFGDIDVLVCSKIDYDYPNVIMSLFNPIKIIRNGNVYSFPFKDVQIDVIVAPSNYFDSYLAFYSWGDLGMCVGRLSRIYDLKYGIDGLSIPIRNEVDNHVVEVMHITDNVPEIYSFLGLDWDWLCDNGLKDQDDIIQFMLRSDLMSADFLSAHSENTKSRKRDRQRKGFEYIHQWFTDNRELLPQKPVRDIPEKFIDKLHHLDKVFPTSKLLDRYNQLIDKIDRTNQANAKFNMKMAIDTYGDNQETYAKIKAWNMNFVDKSAKVEYILEHEVEQLMEEFV